MDTTTGRFISQDSYAGSVYDPVSLHKYLYANSNPVTYSDPSGYYADVMAATVGMAEIAGTIQLNAIGILNSVLASLCVVLTIATGYVLTQYIALQIENIAAGQNISYSLYEQYDEGKAKKITIKEHTDTDPNRDYCVYFLADATGQIAYVGRTKDMEQRMKEHDKTARGHLRLVAYAPGLTYNECRWVEQGGILGFNTLYDPTLGISKSDYIGNKINGISPLNKNAGTYSKFGYTVLRIIYNEVSNEVMNFTEGRRT